MIARVSCVALWFECDACVRVSVCVWVVCVLCVRGACVWCVCGVCE